METFTVAAVVDGNTFIVSQPWEFNGSTGDYVIATGYKAPKTGADAMSAEQKLSLLIQNKKIELGTPHKVAKGKLICDVYFRGINLADYFPEYQE